LIIDEPGLRNRLAVFRDRADAGETLSRMLSRYEGSNGIVMAIPAGGVPVGSVISRRLELPFDLAVVSKVTPPWDTEVGYGAVGFDGSVQLNERLVVQLRLGEKEIREGIDSTRQKVRRRMRELRGNRPFPDLSDRPVILVDDGLASGFTMRVAVESLAHAHANQIVIAVPTGHQHSVEELALKADALYCANLRGGFRFAVAEAYERWSDVPEQELSRWLGQPRE
jgi:predicted phosphoribosyltransferase